MTGSWVLVVRRGPGVERRRFDDLELALAAMRERAAEVAREGPLDHARGLSRDYEPGDRVRARLSLFTGSLWRRREAGIDLMGDGAVVPWAGIMRRRRLEGRSPDRALESVAQALR